MGDCFITVLSGKNKKIEMFNILELLNSNQIPTVKNYKEISLDDQLLEGLFIKIDEEIKVKELFKDSDFSLSKLSAVVGVNPSYISKAIHYNNYNNFNHYINTLRIEYIKNKMSNVDLKKLLYSIFIQMPDFLINLHLTAALNKYKESHPRVY